MIGARATGVVVSDQSDAVAAGDLLIGQVEHMPEQSANRSAEHVQDAQGGHRIVPNGAIAAVRNDDDLSCRIERIPIRVWSCPRD